MLFRRECLELGYESEEYARELWIMCARDILFFVNTFVFTYDPRKIDNPVLPFITYPYQDEVILRAVESRQKGYDMLIDKSRDMGGTWCLLSADAWLYQFRYFQSFLHVSRKEELVDKKDDPDSMFYKLDMLHEYQPEWLRPNQKRVNLHYNDHETHSTIDGCATTQDVSRGGRRSGHFLDEFAAVPDGYDILAATRDATRSRWFLSTYKGAGNAFYELSRKPDEDLVKIHLHWIHHPEKAEGLYLDPHGNPRSPWYDNECKRALHPLEIKQEVDMDPLGSGGQFFDQRIIDELKQETVRNPYMVGRLEYSETDAEPERFVESEHGDLFLWFYPQANGEPDRTLNYVIGIDVSQGTRATNSTACVYNRDTGEKVAEMVSAMMPPEKWARAVVALARWFGGAYMIWESNGPGLSFGAEVVSLGYSNIYYRRNEERIGKKITDTPGWNSNPKTKPVLLGSYRTALETRAIINRSLHALNEAQYYQYMSDGSIAHAGSLNKMDPSGARENHGDRVIGDAVANHVISIWSQKKPKPSEPEIPVNCMAARHASAIKEEKQGKKGWF